MSEIFIKTPRLILRQWQESDLENFAKLNADKEVMRYFPATLTKIQSDELALVIKNVINDNSFGFWAVELAEQAKFIGFTGLAIPIFEAKFMPCMEIGWRFMQEYWGKGYASEAASASLKYAFEALEKEEIVAFTAETNHRSKKVMQRIGMNHNKDDDFSHPRLPENHPLAQHVLYRISKETWLENNKK